MNLSPYVEKKQFVIAGTIDPPSISLNGQQLESPQGKYKNLLINGTTAPLTVTDSLKTFYQSVDSESLNLEWEKNNGEKIHFLKLDFPSLTGLSTNGHELYWDFSNSVAKAKLDTDEINISSPVTELKDLKKWVNRTHVLELTSAGNSNQIYQLDFSSYQRELFRRYSVFYNIGDSSLRYFWNATTSGFGAALHSEDNYYADIIYHYTEKQLNFADGLSTRPVSQKLYELKSHYGYQFLDSNWNDFDLFRLQLGVQGEIARYERISTTMDSFDGYMTDKVDDSYAVIGCFGRWEPWQYKNFGISLTFDFPLMATIGVSKIYTSAYFSLNYYFK